jgi:hypothetical protein
VSASTPSRPAAPPAASASSRSLRPARSGMKPIHGDRIDQSEADESAEPSEREQCGNDDDALARNGYADHDDRRQHRSATTIAVGSPKKPLRR